MDDVPLIKGEFIMIIIKDTKSLEKWLNENNWFEDGYINEIITSKNLDGSVDFIEIRLGCQSEGTLEGGTPITIMEYVIKARDVDLWTFDDEIIHNPDYCIEGIEILEECESIGIVFSVPELVNLKCNNITIEGPFSREAICKPWVSDGDFICYYKDIQIPKPLDWIKWLSELGFNISWRYGGSEAKNSKQVSYPDYSGWFLQETYKIPNTQFGIFFNYVGFKDGKVAIHIRKYAEIKDELWDAITTTLAIKTHAEINCGNCRFKGEEWIEYLRSKTIPEKMF
jgi:hypothetical protein